MSNETDDPIETTDPDALPVNPDEVDEDAATILDEANAGNGGGNTEEIDDDEIDDEFKGKQRKKKAKRAKKRAGNKFRCRILP